MKNTEKEKNIYPLTYRAFLKMKEKIACDEEKWLYEEYLANFKKACPLDFNFDMILKD